MNNLTERLEYFREQLNAESISYDELAELQSLAEHIDAEDIQLLEAAGVPEHPQQLNPETCGASPLACSIVNETFLSLDGFAQLRRQCDDCQSGFDALAFAASIARRVDWILQAADADETILDDEPGTVDAERLANVGETILLVAEDTTARVVVVDRGQRHYLALFDGEERPRVVKWATPHHVVIVSQ